MSELISVVFEFEEVEYISSDKYDFDPHTGHWDEAGCESSSKQLLAEILEYDHDASISIEEVVECQHGIRELMVETESIY